MAQSWRVKAEPKKKPRPPLDEGALERIAVFYVGRYATTRARLHAYLTRKVRERGWDGDRQPPIERLVGRFTELGYIDDAAFAVAKAASLKRRGYGERRVEQALYAAGIADADAADAKEQARSGALAAALRFAERKRIGPFAGGDVDNAARQRAFAAMMRAGHPMEIVRRVLNLSPHEIPDCDSD